MIDIDNKLIEAIQESKKMLTEQFQAYSLEPEIEKIVDDIYKRKSFKSMTGEDGLRLLDKMKEMNTSEKEHTISLISTYEEEIKEIIGQVNDLKKKVLQNSQFKIDSVILKGEK